MDVRVRIAPSPTGAPHLGTAYMALFNQAFAQANNGKFILRIEDTDQKRSTTQSEKVILNSLKWLDLQWDEGPDIGGDYGPYRQSERSDIYQQYAQQLLEQGHAFECYRTAEELDALRNEMRTKKTNPVLTRQILQLDKTECERRKQAGYSAVLRLVVPSEGECVFNDQLRGEIRVAWSQIDAQILLKSDGMPTYHLANVIDDHLMKISHVMRGEEWINSVPKHQLLYQYFDWDMPQMCHLPLLRNIDKSKLSKRKNPTSINYYRAMGYTPQALLNYLALMGWSMPDQSEKFTLQQMVSQFQMKNIVLGGPVFDLKKLQWLNGVWLRENYSDEQLLQSFINWRLNPDFLKKLIPLIAPRVEKFSDIMPQLQLFFNDVPTISSDNFQTINLEADKISQILQLAVWVSESAIPFDKKNLYPMMQNHAHTLDIKLRDFLQPLFIALSGSKVAPPLFDTMEILGAELCIARFRHALGVCGELSKKQIKQLQSVFQQ